MRMEGTLVKAPALDRLVWRTHSCERRVLGIVWSPQAEAGVHTSVNAARTSACATLVPR